MIDDPVKTLMLMAKLRDALPIRVALTPELRRALAAASPDTAIPERAEVVELHNLGDEGGICCALDLGRSDGRAAHVVSLTHLRLDPRSPLFREVEAYQRRRAKKLKRQVGR